MRYETDPLHTFVMFEVLHFGTSTVRARLDNVAGHIDMDEHGRARSADIRIEMASVSSGIAKFDEHLRSEAFFDVAAHPQAHFTGTRFTYAGDALEAVDGELTLLDATHPVTLTATHFNCYDSPLLKAHVCGGDFAATIQRSRWGVNWGLDLGVPDAVRLVIQIEAFRSPEHAG